MDHRIHSSSHYSSPRHSGSLNDHYNRRHAHAHSDSPFAVPTAHGAPRGRDVSERAYERMAISNPMTQTAAALIDRGNQLDDIYSTRGSSTLRTNAGRSAGWDDPISSGLYAENCGGHRRAAEHMLSSFRSEHREHSGMPITVHHYDGDHTYASLGDPRMEPASDVIAHDSWPTNPRPHPLDENVFYGDGSRTRVESSTLQAPPEYNSSRLRRMPSDEFDHHLHGRTYTSSERSHRFDDMSSELRRIRQDDRHLWAQERAHRDTGPVHYRNSGTGEVRSYDYATPEDASARRGRYQERLSANWPPVYESDRDSSTSSGASTRRRDRERSYEPMDIDSGSYRSRRY